MNALWSVLVLLVVAGLASLVPLSELVDNDPGYGSLAGGIAIAVAILLHALTNLMACERQLASSASKEIDKSERTEA